MRILYFYPENPLYKTQGNNARALALLEYFKSRKIEVDFVGLATTVFTANEIEKLKEEKLISNGSLLPIFIRRKNKLKYFFYYSLPNKIGAKFGKRIGLFDRTRLGQVDAFEDILKTNNYDAIIISYVYWSKLIKNSKHIKNAKLIIDTHDFLTSQFQMDKKFQLGKFFEKEINSLKLFDEILVVSIEEKYLFSQFVNKKVTLATHALPQKSISKSEIIYDLVYVASDNDHNINSVKWFFNSVYPLLLKSIKILVIGKICKYVDDYSNVTKIAYAEDLDVLYSQSKIAICPMLSGTGVKIKVIEALSFGLPVVCNERGVDGLLNKTQNGCLVTDDKNQFADYITQLVTDGDFYNKISSEATSFFNDYHTLDKNYKVLDTVFEL